MSPRPQTPTLTRWGQSWQGWFSKHEAHSWWLREINICLWLKVSRFKRLRSKVTYTSHASCRNTNIGYSHEFLKGVTMHSGLHAPRCVPNMDNGGGDDYYYYDNEDSVINIYWRHLWHWSCVNYWEDKGRKADSFTFACPVPSWRSRSWLTLPWVIMESQSWKSLNGLPVHFFNKRYQIKESNTMHMQKYYQAYF